MNPAWVTKQPTEGVTGDSHGGCTCDRAPESSGHVVGDARLVGNAEDAISDAYRICSQI